MTAVFTSRRLGPLTPPAETHPHEVALRLALSLLVALILLFAAGAKLAGVWSAWHAAQTNARTLGVDPTGLGAAHRLDILIAAVEVLIAGGLIALRQWWGAWAFIATLFASYAGYTGVELLLGARSCGCFGPLDVPPAVTFTVDALLAATAFTMTVHGVLSRPGVRGWLLSAMAAGLLAGAAYAHALAPPPSALENNPQLQSVFERTLALPELAPLTDTSPDSPTWLLFVYDIYCEHCAEFLPYMQAREKQWASDPNFRVKTISMQDIEKQAGVPLFRWPSTPTIARIKQGVVVELLSSERVFDPIVVRQRVLSNTGKDGD